MSRLAKNNAKLKIDIYNYLKSHGRSLSSDLEIIFSISGSEVRQIIRDLRRDGEPVASGGDGYWIATNYDEIKSTVEHLESRAISEWKTAQRLKKTFGVEQLQLEFHE